MYEGTLANDDKNLQLIEDGAKNDIDGDIEAIIEDIKKEGKAITKRKLEKFSLWGVSFFEVPSVFFGFFLCDAFAFLRTCVQLLLHTSLNFTIQPKKQQ